MFSIMAPFYSGHSGYHSQNVQITYTPFAHAPKNILVIVDESACGDFIDLNIDRGVTPYLQSQSNRIINFGIASSVNNCSAGSNACLRMGANPNTKRLSLDAPNITYHPTLWKYAKQAGYSTYYWNINYFMMVNLMDTSELKLIDHYLSKPSKEPLYLLDHQAIPDLKSILSKPGKKLIYLNKAGAHFFYEGLYPETERHYQPCLTASPNLVERPKLINSYKNAIRWSVDRWFQKFLDKLDLTDTIVIYTSDHGRNLLDDGNLITHCRIAGATTYEALVPFFVMTDHKEWKEKFKKAAQLNYNQASCFQIFPTLLEIMGYSREGINHRYYKTLFQKAEKKVGFTSGSVLRNPLTWNKFFIPSPIRGG